MEAIIAEATKLRQELHLNPEPSNKEKSTLEILRKFLNGVQSQYNKIIDMTNWICVAHIEGESFENIALRADFDAVLLPDGTCSHLCGHDGHSAILYGVALAIKDQVLNRNVFMIFQHAEETGKGARECLEFLKHHNIQRIFGLHNIPGFQAGSILIREGTFACASRGLIIQMRGTPAHAANPSEGLNPTPALARVTLRLPEIQQQFRRFVLATVVGLHAGQETFGVAASEGRLMLTIRAEADEDLESLCAKIVAAAEEEAKKDGVEVSFEDVDVFPATVNDQQMVDIVSRAAQAKGMTVQALEKPFRWSEDFGHYLKEIPGAFFGLGAGEGCSGLHTAAYKFDDALIETGISVMLSIVVTQPLITVSVPQDSYQQFVLYQQFMMYQQMMMQQQQMMFNQQQPMMFNQQQQMMFNQQQQMFRNQNQMGQQMEPQQQQFHFGTN